MNDIDKMIQDEKLSIGGKEFTLGDILGIDETALSEEYAGQAARYAYVGIMASNAEAKYQEAKAAREFTYSDVENSVRTEFEASGNKATEGKVKAAVVVHEDYDKAVDDELEAYREWKALRAMADATRQRGDMLISLGATLRQEYGFTGMTLMEQTKAALKSEE